MADLLDQYETTMAPTASLRGLDGSVPGVYSSASSHGLQEPISSGYVSVQTEEERPIFEKKRMNFRPPANIIDFAISNNIVAIALENNQVMRLDLVNPEDIDTVDITKKSDDRIHKIFLDPNGRHLIIAMESTDAYYLGRSNKKPKSLQKFKTHMVEAIGWNKALSNETTTREILIGTNKGLIIETEIESEEKFLITMGAERHFKQVFNVNENLHGGSMEEPVTGIALEKYPGSEKRYFVMITTLSRLYQYIGEASTEPPMVGNIFTTPEAIAARYLELSGGIPFSDLKFFYPRPKGAPKYFAWITGPGIYFGGLDFSRKDAGNNITVDTRLLTPTEGRVETPIGVAVTEFHCIQIYPDNTFEAICTLNNEIVLKDVISSRLGKLIGLRTDSVSKSYWVFTSSSIFQYVVQKENRDVWKLYLDKGNFEAAKDHCKDNPAQLDIVLRKQAENLFLKNAFQEAATYYALTQMSFEEVALKFLQVEDPEALKMFLLKKMVNLKPQDKTQMIMIVTWLVELYLNQLGDLRDKGSACQEEFTFVQEEFRKFIKQSRVKTCLKDHTQVAYDLLSSHGDTENMIFFAMLMQEYDKVITHHIQQDDYLSALDVLKTANDRTLYEKFAPVLMKSIPKETIEVWKQKDLDPKSLITALVTHEQNTDKAHIETAIDYLEHCVNKLRNKEAAIHNYLISLYCKLDYELPLLTYLNGQGEDPDDVPYDLKYALRLCSEHNKPEACVHIYSTMGLFEEAVDLALKVDIEKAKIYADKPEDDDVLRKKLWLKVARHVVEQQQNISWAMELLNECSLLKIEDILPFFTDFVTIDQFKDAICKSLQDYNKRIDDLKDAMEEATESAKVVRSEIRSIRGRYATIAAQEKCAICCFPLLTRSFYFFPCTHVFHSDCLINEVTKQMRERQKTKVEEIQSELRSVTATLIASSSATSASSTSAALQQREQLRNELDDLIAAECPYCGDIMIRSIDKPFIKPSEYEKVMESWK